MRVLLIDDSDNVLDVVEYGLRAEWSTSQDSPTREAARKLFGDTT